jgi:hypothetical protein
VNLSRREALAGLGAAATAATGIGWLRVADVRPYDPDATVSADRPTNERVVTAADRLWELDHRADVTVDVLEDGSGESPYRAEHHRVFHQPSRRRTWFHYTTRRFPAGDPGPTLGTTHALRHYGTAKRREGGLPASHAVFLSDGFLASDPEAPVPDDSDARPRLSEDAVGADYGDYLTLRGLLSVPPHVRDHRANWTEVERDDETVTFRIDDRDGYAQVPPLPDVVSVDEGSRVSVTFDRESGLLRRIVDERAVTRRTNYGEHDATHDPREYRYRIETRLGEYGEATAPPPVNRPEAGLDGRLRGTWLDVKRY